MADSSVQVAVPPDGTPTKTVSSRTNASGEEMQAIVHGVDGSDDVFDIRVLEDLAQDLGRLASALAMAMDPTTGRLRTTVEASVQAVLAPGGNTVGSINALNSLNQLQYLGVGSGPLPNLATVFPFFQMSSEAALALRTGIVVS